MAENTGAAAPKKKQTTKAARTPAATLFSRATILMYVRSMLDSDSSIKAADLLKAAVGRVTPEGLADLAFLRDAKLVRALKSQARYKDATAEMKATIVLPFASNEVFDSACPVTAVKNNTSMTTLANTAAKTVTK